MKVNMKMEEEMEKELSILVLEKNMLVNSEMEKEKARGLSIGMIIVDGKDLS